MAIAVLSPSFRPAKSMTLERKKRAAVEAISQKKTITELVDEHNTRRKFMRQQGRKAQAAIDNVFHIDKAGNDDVIYYLPVTKTWFAQLVLELMFLGHSSYRNIAMTLKDLLDYDISMGSIHNIFDNAVEEARQVNAGEDLTNIEVTPTTNCSITINPFYLVWIADRCTVTFSLQKTNEMTTPGPST